MSDDLVAILLDDAASLQNAGHVAKAERLKKAADEIERLRADNARFCGRLCVNCGRTFPASHPREKSPDDCLSPEVCTIDVTFEEAFEHWRQIANKLQSENARLREALEGK